MIWIHGGGFTQGTSHFGIGGMVRNFVSKGIVVASIEYRLGWLGRKLKGTNFKCYEFLGFFTTLTADFPANLGLLDQVNLGVVWMNLEAPRLVLFIFYDLIKMF